MKTIKDLVRHFRFLIPRLILIAIPVVYLIFAFLTYFDYFESYLYPLRFIQGKASALTENIIIGPYPHYEELQKLKEEYHVTEVISLLNLRLPQEKALYERERGYSEKLGLRSISVPMEYIPVDSESNKKALGEIVSMIQKNRKGIFYIHCYLGKHRVTFVKQGLIAEGFIPTDKNANK